MKKMVFLLLSVLLCGQLTACSEASTAAAESGQEVVMTEDPKRDAELLAARLAEIKAVIGKAEADQPAQCKIVGVGQKPCGGPATYLAYSTRDIDETAFLAQVAAYNELAKDFNQRSGMMSDCAIVPVPQVALVAGVCKIGTGADAL